MTNMDPQERNENQQFSSAEQDGIEWAQRERKKADFVRVNAGRLNIDPKRFVLGQIIEIISLDDANCFNTRSLFETSLYTQTLSIQRRAILERLDWESTSHEVPEHLRNRLLQTRDFIERHEWTDKKTFEQASERWYGMRKYFGEEVDKDDDLQADQIYFRVKQDLVDKEYTASGGK